MSDKVSYKVELYKLQSALDNALTCLQRAQIILSALLKEQMEGNEE